MTGKADALHATLVAFKGRMSLQEENIIEVVDRKHEDL